MEVFGNIIRLDITLDGAMHDRNLFNCYTPLREKDEFFSGGEHAVGDTGFIGYGPIVCLFKKN